MKILCISDQVDPLVYSAGITERFGDTDLVLSAGDLNLDYYGFIVSMLNKNLYFVFGNHNLKRLSFFKKKNDHLNYDASDYFTNPGGIYIGGKVVRDKKAGLLIAGLGGSMRYNDGANQHTEFEMFLMMLSIVPRLLWNRIAHGRFLDILLTHSPPRHIHDKEDPCHRGFKVFRWFLKVFRPKIMIHGHVHLMGNEPRPISVFHKTTIYNAFNHFILEFEQNR